MSCVLHEWAAHNWLEPVSDNSITPPYRNM
jgi:hypothetical protein